MSNSPFKPGVNNSDNSILVFKALALFQPWVKVKPVALSKYLASTEALMVSSLVVLPLTVKVTPFGATVLTSTAAVDKW